MTDLSIELLQQTKSKNSQLQRDVETLQRANRFKSLVLVGGVTLSCASLALSIYSLVSEQTPVGWASLVVSTASLGVSSLGLFKKDFNQAVMPLDGSEPDVESARGTPKDSPSDEPVSDEPWSSVGSLA